MRKQIKRGMLKVYTLKLLVEEERTGYDLMKTIEEETGFWKPSAGSIYPLLQTLEESGLIKYHQEDDKKLYSLTEDGKEALQEAEDAKAEVFESISRSLQVFARIFDDEEVANAIKLMKQTHLKDIIPGAIEQRFIEMRGVLFDIQSGDMPSELKKDITQILGRTINSLKELIRYQEKDKE